MAIAISVIVKRRPADYQGDDISDPLIVTEAQARARGRAEIDKYCSNRVMVSGRCIFQHYMEPGKIVQVDDIQRGRYKGMLRSFSLSMDYKAGGKFSATTSIVVEREVIKK